VGRGEGWQAHLGPDWGAGFAREEGEVGRDRIMEVIINLIMLVDILSYRQQAGYNRQVA
jgi:hypothetical protein